MLQISALASLWLLSLSDDDAHRFDQMVIEAKESALNVLNHAVEEWGDIKDEVKLELRLGLKVKPGEEIREDLRNLKMTHISVWEKVLGSLKGARIEKAWRHKHVERECDRRNAVGFVMDGSDTISLCFAAMYRGTQVLTQILIHEATHIAFPDFSECECELSAVLAGLVNKQVFQPTGYTDGAGAGQIGGSECNFVRKLLTRGLNILYPYEPPVVGVVYRKQIGITVETLERAVERTPEGALFIFKLFQTLPRPPSDATKPVTCDAELNGGNISLLRSLIETAESRGDSHVFFTVIDIDYHWFSDVFRFKLGGNQTPPKFYFELNCEDMDIDDSVFDYFQADGEKDRYTFIQ